MILKKLYDRCVELARHKFSKPLLGFVAFIESFFFPVPPDLMIVPMVVAKREDYLKIFLIATTGSVLGGLFGYMLGVFFLDASMVIIEFYGYEEKVFEMQDKMSTKGGFLAWLGIMFLAGFTPLVIVKTLNGRGVNPAKNMIPSQAKKPPLVDIFSCISKTFSSYP